MFVVNILFFVFVTIFGQIETTCQYSFDLRFEPSIVVLIPFILDCQLFETAYQIECRIFSEFYTYDFIYLIDFAFMLILCFSLFVYLLPFAYRISLFLFLFCLIYFPC